jgi:hypothetical protein
MPLSVRFGTDSAMTPGYVFVQPLVPNSFHVLQEHLLAAAVIEFRCPAVGVAGDSLSGFQGAVIFQKIRDPGRPKGVRRIVRRQSSLFEPSFKHVRGVGAHERPARYFARFAQGGREQRRTWLCSETGRFEVFVQELLQLVVDGKLLLFAAFLFKAEQKAFSGRIIVFDFQVHDGADVVFN